MTYRYPSPIQPLNPARELIEGLTWYALISKQAHEYRAAHWLEEVHGGCMTLVPLEYRRRSKGKKGGVFKSVSAEYTVPLMPRIVFAGFGDIPTWPRVLKSPHVSGAIGLNGSPAPIPAVQIRRFRSHAEQDRVAAGLPVLKIGSRAIFVGDGIFSGHILEIADLGPKFATVWQEFFGSRRQVKVSRDDLEAA